MRNKLFIILLFIPLISNAQLSHFGSLEYVNAGYKMIDQSQHFYIEYELPEFSMNYGIRYDYKIFYVSLKAEVMMDIEKISKYTPKIGYYTFESGFRISKSISIKYSHSCVHPIITDGVMPIFIYGGGDRIGIFLKTSSY
jgi:hypothetical protein